jgi:hypothetical protein
VARIQLVVDDEIAEELDQGVALSTIETRERQTRTSFIVRLVRAEVARLRKEATAGKPADTPR